MQVVRGEPAGQGHVRSGGTLPLAARAIDKAAEDRTERRRHATWPNKRRHLLLALWYPKFWN